VITEDNYFAINNRGLSQSKIKAYELCPNYMYRLYISGDLVRKDNKNFMIGTEVDSLLTELDKARNVYVFDGDFRTKANREMRDELEAAGKIVVKADEYEKIMAIAIAVQETSIWRQIEKTFVFQDILTKPMALGDNFDCLYGKPDAYHIAPNGVCTLLDLKTSVTIDKRAFFYRAQDLGYFKQLWMYSHLLKHKYPEIKAFKYYFVVAEKSEPYRVVLFSIPVHMVEALEDDMQDVITRIAADKDFKKADITWDCAIPLTLFEDKSYDQGSEGIFQVA
jgi:hypothetical protein